MKGFLAQIGLGMVKLLLGFVLVSIAARFVEPFNWFFFQRNEHNRVFLAMLEMEKALARGDKFDVLIFGSSSCEFALDPILFADSTGLRVFKFATGGQSIEMTDQVMRYLAPRLQPKYVLFDAFPLYGSSYTDEGVERALLNAPNASSGLSLAILSTSPYSLTTDYLWAARAIGTALSPFGEQSLETRSEFEMVAPGFTRENNAIPSAPDAFMRVPFFGQVVDKLNVLDAEMAGQGHEMVAIVPTAQNVLVEVEGKPDFPLLVPHPRPDTCFWDQTHMREQCVEGYTMEVVRLFNRFRSGIEDSRVRLPVKHQ